MTAGNHHSSWGLLYNVRYPHRKNNIQDRKSVRKVVRHIRLLPSHGFR